ncbi:purine and uridine phosphorylase [Thozetella sp. PMI_491]|nr:purine and uridine phosphorylase [Thozetella sp. PMI_491]
MADYSPTLELNSSNVPEHESSFLAPHDIRLPSNNIHNGRALAPVQWAQSTSAEPALDVSDASALGLEAFIESYTIAWICALQEEFQAACQMLDVDDFPAPRGMEANVNDRNVYVFGQLGDHYIVVGCLPRGRTGLVNAANVAMNMIRSFPSLKFALMVGIGGGAPTKSRDIRLGDVVVSTPSEDHGGVVQLDFGVRLANGLFQRRGQLNSPPDALLAATQDVQRLLDNPKKPDRIAEHIARMNHMRAYRRPTRDNLYKIKYAHRDAPAEQENAALRDDEDEDWDQDEVECRCCDENEVVKRRDRDSFREVTVHYGTIASDNVVMRDAEARDKHAKDEKLKVLCFEMEAGGLMNNFPCLVIRGICDYSDSHKNDEWHNYAALAAAAYARELLLVLRRQMVTILPAWGIEAQHGE